MAGYIKKIALLRSRREGFSSDGRPVHGLVRCEAYGGRVRAEVSLINFAPLTKGEYRAGLTDGNTVVLFSPPVYEGATPLNLSGGFACLVCFCCEGSVLPVACAASGAGDGWLAQIEVAMLAAEGGQGARYNDEAIADENYYENEAAQNGGAVRQGGQEEEGVNADKDEAHTRPGQGQSFFERVSADVKNILSSYPRIPGLEAGMAGSRWVKIAYGSGSHYAFGVVYSGGNAQFLCYGVPVGAGAPCPKSMQGRASYISTPEGGYWVMYQSAQTGDSTKGA